MLPFYPNPLTAIDFYKTDHRRQYPDNTEFIGSNFTPRSSKHAHNISKFFDDQIINFGLTFFIKDTLVNTWNYGFFHKPKADVVKKYKRRLDNALGFNAVPVDHIERLHDLGYLPISIRSLPEGELVNIKVPLFTIVNTHKDFGWLTNYLETVLSANNWKLTTNATTAFEYRRVLSYWAKETGAPMGFVPFQGHDFSARGMSHMYDACVTGAAHLTSFVGTDTVGAIDVIEDYYNGDSDKELLGCSVAATEHSVVGCNGKASEIDMFRRFINVLYPKGIVSIVSDTWDYWQVITKYLPELKSEILARQPDANGNAKLVIRPDSGNPIHIVAGYIDSEYYIKDGKYYSVEDNAELQQCEIDGTVSVMWDIFGGTTTDKGFKVLDSHIGLIYGDSITIKRADEILRRLHAKGFASCNCVFGIGSYSYQSGTRDTYGHAMKATWGIVDGEFREIFKDPKTDSGVKKSARGRIRVEKEGNDYVLYDQQTEEQANGGALVEVFRDGKLLRDTSISEIRGRIDTQIENWLKTV